MEDGGLGTPQERQRDSRQSKKKRHRGYDYDEVMSSSRGKNDSIEKKRNGKYLRVTPSLDHNRGGSKESEGKPSSKKKMIYTETPSLELEKNYLKRGRTPSVPHEEELFYLSDKIWGDVNQDHEINQQFTRQSSNSCSFRPFNSLDPQPSDKFFVGEVGLALTAITRNQSNPVQVALEQFKLLSQSLNTRKNYGNQILEAWIAPKKEELYELEEQKIAMSYLDTKIKHGRLVSDACNASHSFGNEFSQGKQGSCNIATDCGLNKDRPKAMNVETIGCRKPITGKASNTSPHSQERKKRKIENQENHCNSSIPSDAVASFKEINESTTSFPDGMTVEVLVKGKPDGKVASPGKQVKIYFTFKLRDAEDFVASNIGGAPDILNLGYEKTCKGLSIGIEGMHVGEKRRLTIPPSLGREKLPDSWIQYDVELVDICE
ncbi:peptidyl-prolyl cis-trans isomerase FKBP43-like [Lycium barbarum]|uniref:peptidyl-prolyl cis-trans isomerase FKBP43-like n=1 Tax=Lycium barbarum TaxID=112863 RepID=UPI00293E76C1|nr:peptidyl-prolyl cis-trans isomerase FKBP43-like [Lycium barbarum]